METAMEPVVHKKKSEFARQAPEDKVLLVVCFIILALFLVAIIAPVVYIILASFVDPITLQNQGLTFDFSKWTLTAYERVMTNAQIWIGFRNALFYSIASTALSVVITLLAAYPMSRPDFKGKGIYNLLFMITMFFGGGLIPTYLLISDLNMLDTIWALIVPGAFSVWNMIVARTYYQGIPRDLEEAASIDGASEMTYFFRILIPVCTPIIATIAMWCFVGMWNSYFDAMIYLKDSNKFPLQLVLRSILIQSQPEPGMVSDMQSTAERAQLAELLKYATIIISSLPLLIMYPFFQKYFDSGIMAGAVKG